MNVCDRDNVTHIAVSISFLAVLILIPTRELALQTSAIVKELGKHMGIQCMVTTGGTSLKDDIMRLYNAVHVIVATPVRGWLEYGSDDNVLFRAAPDDIVFLVYR